jgi:hypothetical protein
MQLVFISIHSSSKTCINQLTISSHISAITNQAITKVPKLHLQFTKQSPQLFHTAVNFLTKSFSMTTTTASSSSLINQILSSAVKFITTKAAPMPLIATTSINSKLQTHQAAPDPCFRRRQEPNSSSPVSVQSPAPTNLSQDPCSIHAASAVLRPLMASIQSSTRGRELLCLTQPCRATSTPAITTSLIVLCQEEKKKR